MHFSRMLILSVTVTCATWAAAVPARAQTEAELAYGNAKLLFEKGDWAQARDLLVAASQTDDKNPDIFVLLGKAEYQLGNGKRAAELAKANGKTTEDVIHPGDVLRATRSLSDMYEKQGTNLAGVFTLHAGPDHPAADNGQ